jgi:hypothetical protein
MRYLRAALVMVLAGVVADMTAAQQGDFHAIVEGNGAVVMCIAKGELLFADRCEGNGRLTIVQPMEEGEIVWRTAVGAVVMQNESPQNPACALARAKWDPTVERSVRTGKWINRADRRSVVMTLKEPNVTEADVTAFSLDLDNDGREEIVFAVDTVPRVADLNEKTKKTYPYVVIGGIRTKGSQVSHRFSFERGAYSGGTDAIGHVSFKGIVPIATNEGEMIALLVRDTSPLDGKQALIRFRQDTIQRTDTIEFVCN